MTHNYVFLSLQPVGFVTFSTRAGAEAAKQDLQVRTVTPNSTSKAFTVFQSLKPDDDDAQYCRQLHCTLKHIFLLERLRESLFLTSNFHESNMHIRVFHFIKLLKVTPQLTTTRV